MVLGDVHWHYETLPRSTKKAFIFLSEQKWLKKSNWYLAGGTALALWCGNRKSLDLDFFIKDKDFTDNQVLKYFIGNKNWKLELNKENTIFAKLFNAKISFISYPFFEPRQDLVWHGSVRVLHPIDIAVMKIIAISQRGKKRDFFDLYWCAHNIELLTRTIKRLKVQYPLVVHNYHHILKSLVYFDDAENDPEPEIYFNASWSKVKKFFTKEISIIADRILR